MVLHLNLYHFPPRSLLRVVVINLQLIIQCCGFDFCKEKILPSLKKSWANGSCPDNPKDTAELGQPNQFLRLKLLSELPGLRKYILSNCAEIRIITSSSLDTF